MTITRKRLIYIGVAVFVLIAVIYGFMPDPVSVQVATAERGSMQVVIEEEGRTEVVDRFVVALPAAAVVRSIEVQAGDVVEEGDVLAQLQGPPAAILDPRSRAEAEARLAGAEAAVQQAERQVDAAEAAWERAQEQRARVERLFEQESATRQMLEQAVSEEMQARANLESARAAVTGARAELMSAQATLETGRAFEEGRPVRDVLRAPTGGRILAIHRRSRGLVNAGEPLLEVGETERMEVHVDVLSQDALRIEPGMPVLLEQWGGEGALEATVERVEPRARTEVSALGVEEQRVTVVASLDSPQEEWEGLGSGYRVLARFIVWQEDDVLQVPTSALFRTDDGWALFVIENGRAARRDVEVGNQAELWAQIVDGVEEGEEVIVHPGNDVEDDVRVAPRG